MSRVTWSNLKKMDEEQIRREFLNLAVEIEKLTPYVGMITDDTEHEKFLSDFSYCLDTLHSLRNRVDTFYFKLD